MIRSPCARHAHFLYTSLLQSRKICMNPLHSQLPGGPGTSLPFSGRKTQNLRSLPYRARVPGRGTYELVSFGLARLCDPAESWESSQTLSASSAAVHCRTETPAFCVLGQGKSSHPYSAFWTCEKEESLCLLFQGPGEWAGRLIYPPLPSS